jgi:succinate dehydrogenase flavin-adding protein (antitoxin of CptAB toxin-antitoxin module)
MPYKRKQDKAAQMKRYREAKKEQLSDFEQILRDSNKELYELFQEKKHVKTRGKK